MTSNRTNFFNLILHLIITTVFSQQTECPWSFRFSLLCSDFNPVLGGDCMWDASEKNSITATVEGQSRCHSNARALCADRFFVGYGSVCFNRCQRFHATCCCPAVTASPTSTPTVSPTSTPTVSKIPTTANPTSTPSDSPTTAPATTSPTPIPSVTKNPTPPTKNPSSAPVVSPTSINPTATNTLTPTEEEQDRCPWVGFEGSCVGYDCKFSAGNGAQVWRCILNSSGGCAATFCPALCTAFHSQCCCPS
mmetsp:Transcript_18318/g.21085  ORF Transcript_18318/g.21085 Transcript_18318/m.21085 type:complete len:250 (-) Transcript_18318:121-870(-)